MTDRGFTFLDDEASRDAEVEIRTTRLVVPEDAIYFEGHFPSDPVLPAVAQLAELILPRVQVAWPDLPHLTSAPRMKFSQLIRPGASLELRLTRRDGSSRVDYVLSDRDRVCATGALVFSPSA